jgi:drug/metabolite transporter (DMT)-like permease
MKQYGMFPTIHTVIFQESHLSYLSVIVLSEPVSLRHVFAVLCVFLGIVFITKKPRDAYSTTVKVTKKSNIYPGYGQG